MQLGDEPGAGRFVLLARYQDRLRLAAVRIVDRFIVAAEAIVIIAVLALVVFFIVYRP